MSILSVKDLTVNYGAIRALKGICLDVEPGEIITLIGANGAGKTSTMNAIMGVIPKTGGSVKEPSRSCASWVLRIKNTICPAASPTVNSADWKSHVPWRPIPQSCSSTSLPQA